MKNIIIIFGGVSPEHDVSIITGCLVINSLDRQKFNPIPLYVTKSGQWFTGDKLKKLAFFKQFTQKGLTEVYVRVGENILYRKKGSKKLFSIAGAINCMHGGSGENGTIGALFDLCNIPFASSGMFQSSLSMDKTYTKICLKGIGVDYVPYDISLRKTFFADMEGECDRLIKSLSLPIIVKPSTLGSSIGISVAKDKSQLKNALIYAFKFSEKVLLERFLEGFTELNCSAYKKDGQVVVSRVEAPKLSHPILTFEDKYLGGKNGEQHNFYSNVSQEIDERVKSLTKKIYTQLDFSFVVRMDYILHENKLYLNEINAVPGSLAYYLYFDKTRGLTDLLTDLLQQAFSQSREKNANNLEYNTDILSFKGVRLKK